MQFNRIIPIFQKSLPSNALEAKTWYSYFIQDPDLNPKQFTKSETDPKIIIPDPQYCYLQYLCAIFSYAWLLRHPVGPVPECKKMPMPYPVRNQVTLVRYRNATVSDWDAGCRWHWSRCRCPAMFIRTYLPGDVLHIVFVQDLRSHLRPVQKLSPIPDADLKDYRAGSPVELVYRVQILIFH